MARKNLISLGTCIGRFTHSNKFRLQIGALQVLSKHAQHKVRTLPFYTFSRLQCVVCVCVCPMRLPSDEGKFSVFNLTLS